MELWDIYDINGLFTGKIIDRDTKLDQDEYHLIIYIYIFNSKGELLVQRRTLSKNEYPGVWETTCGSAISGETSIEACLREVNEELGIELNPKSLLRLKRLINSNSLVDIWVTTVNFLINDYMFNEKEVLEIKYLDFEDAIYLIFYQHPEQKISKAVLPLLRRYKTSIIKKD